ncbi:MAG: cysteine synthase A [Firmicutes bacterium]|nr:cysteine synthase A [Bacillota bacterium]
MIYQSVAELVGKTPLLQLCNLEGEYNLQARLLAKLESFNPAGSAKDRIALEMIEDAEKSGVLQSDSVIIEPTSGNTGIGLCAIASAKGYRCIIVMPDSMSVERRLLMKAYGAELILTEGAKGMQGAVEMAEELKAQIPNSIIAGQFTNPANPSAHYKTTGPEIWEDTQGRIDIFVAGVGTGGTISGTGKYLKEKNPDIKVIAVEPEASPLLSKGMAGPHTIQGIGANFVPETLDKTVIDEIVTVSGENAFATGRKIAAREGVLVGISSGAALYAALQIAQRAENIGKTIVVLLPDTGERYLTSAMFAE